MDATTRWETEAMRGGGKKRLGPPKPSQKRASTEFVDSRHWVTLREAEEATGIPTNTLRKWVRRADLPSYLEADGDLALRMVDLDAVISRATELGREIQPVVLASGGTGESSSQGGVRASEPGTTEPPEPTSSEEPPPGSMIVPIDAWNKMLNQLGNLHEAGQQLAEARERAAKAETESKFLREQLAEGRTESPEPEPDVTGPEPEPDPEPEDTTTYWRYLTTGWRERKKRN
jgi:hypothetical protein